MRQEVVDAACRLRRQALERVLEIVIRFVTVEFGGLDQADDDGGDAEQAGLVMRAMQLLIFGNPKAGTPLLVAAPRIGLGLPHKALAWENEDGAVWLSFKSPEDLEARYALAP